MPSIWNVASMRGSLVSLGGGWCYFCEEEFDFIGEEPGPFCNPLVAGTWIEMEYTPFSAEEFGNHVLCCCLSIF
jgi:hypothetical protein